MPEQALDGIPHRFGIGVVTEFHVYVNMMEIANNCSQTLKNEKYDAGMDMYVLEWYPLDDTPSV